MAFDGAWIVAACFVTGLLLRSSGLASQFGSGPVFRLVFFVTLPALVFTNVSVATLDRESALFPLAGFGICVVSAIAATAYGRLRRLSPDETRAIVLGAGIANLLFTYPFVAILLGPNALTTTILLDIGNAFFAATVANKIAVGDFGRPLARVFRTPLFVAVVFAIGVNVSNAELPIPALTLAESIGSLTIPITVFGLGLSLDPGRLSNQLARTIVFLRMGAGLLIGIPVALVIASDSVTAAIVIVSAAAPVGFSAATFASVGGLDIESVATAITLSALIGLITVPVMLVLLPLWI